MNVALILVVGIGLVLAGLRIGGVTHEAYQAAAHLFVGGLFGAWLVQRNATTLGEAIQARVNLWTAIVLSVVEVGAFLWSVRNG